MVLYPNKLPESERVCSGICSLQNGYNKIDKSSILIEEWQDSYKHSLEIKLLPLRGISQMLHKSFNASKRTFVHCLEEVK